MTTAFLKIIFFLTVGWFFSSRIRSREEVLSFLNKYLYYFALPVIIVYKISSLESSSINLSFAAVNLIPIIIVSTSIFILWKSSFFSINQARTLIIASVLGNTVYLGLPASVAFIGESALAYAVLSSALHNLVIFTFCLILINLISEDEFIFSTFISHTVKNPVLMSSFIGIVMSFLSIRFSGFVNDLFKEISSTVIPFSLITLGFSLYGKIKLISRVKEISIALSVKLIILPFIAAFVIYLSNDITLPFKVTFIQHTMPTAVMAYIVAKEMELDDELISAIIVISTFFYFLLIPLYSLVMKIMF